MNIITEMSLIFTEFATELQIFADGVPGLLIFCVAVALVFLLGGFLTAVMMMLFNKKISGRK